MNGQETGSYYSGLRVSGGLRDITPTMENQVERIKTRNARWNYLCSYELQDVAR